MVQKKYFLIPGVLVILVGLGGGGWFVLSHHKQTTVNDGLGSNFGESAQAAAGGASGQNIPLTPSSSSGLNADSTPASGNLGQLSGPQTSNSNSSGSGASSSSSGSSAQGLDPSTFGQYDKYQNGTSALFGDMQTGTGTELTSGHQATVYYKGWLTNGTLFDESRPGANGQLQPFSFTLGAHQVITGWEEGVVGMKVGGTRLLVVPPAVGYGASGQGSIPPNAVLVFEVQLLAVQ